MFPPLPIESVTLGSRRRAAVPAKRRLGWAVDGDGAGGVCCAALRSHGPAAVSDRVGAVGAREEAWSAAWARAARV